MGAKTNYLFPDLFLKAGYNRDRKDHNRKAKGNTENSYIYNWF